MVCLRSTTGQSMLAKIKNAAALHTPARLKGFNAHLSDFGPVYATTQTRNFACSSSEYIDILVSTEMDETVVDSLGKPCNLVARKRLSILNRYFTQVILLHSELRCREPVFVTRSEVFAAHFHISKSPRHRLPCCLKKHTVSCIEAYDVNN